MHFGDALVVTGAVELAARNIRVNAVAPGTIATEAVKRLSDAYVAGVKAMHPIGRLGRPDEVARAILFLPSDDASLLRVSCFPSTAAIWHNDNYNNAGRRNGTHQKINPARHIIRMGD